ncbi:MAG: hypothetical protein M3Y48_11840 [Actinomycetota bacterium]|nr:hypothetical protein [Actinomycetota bacterium]
MAVAQVAGDRRIGHRGHTWINPRRINAVLRLVHQPGHGGHTDALRAEQIYGRQRRRSALDDLIGTWSAVQRGDAEQSIAELD